MTEPRFVVRVNAANFILIHAALGLYLSGYPLEKDKSLALEIEFPYQREDSFPSDHTAFVKHEFTIYANDPRDLSLLILALDEIKKSFNYFGCQIYWQVMNYDPQTNKYYSAS